MKKFFANIWTFIITLAVGSVNTLIWLVMTVIDIAAGTGAHFLGIANIVWLVLIVIVGLFIFLHFKFKE